MTDHPRPADAPSRPHGPTRAGNPPPSPGPAPTAAGERSRQAFRQLNRWLMLPTLRAGLGAWLGSPLGGWMLLLRARGRRSGVVRETPLNYLVADGSVWVIAGYGERTDWYRNLQADPEVEVWLPGRRLRARATTAADPGIRARVLPPLIRSTRLPSQLAGLRPWTATDAEIVAALDGSPLVRIDADTGPIEAGPDDPGGRAWIWRYGLVLLMIVAVRAAVRAAG